MDAHAASHPTDRALSGFGLGKLDDASAEAVNKHLEHCVDCRNRVAELAPDSFLGRILQAQKPATHAMSEPSQPDATKSYKGANGSAAPPIHTLPPGLADHPDYEIKRELGRGGMGVVYLAHHKWMDRDEVLKVMGRHIMERPGVLERFQREIRAVAKLRHPNIVTAYHATQVGDSLVFAMEYVEGADLAKLVKAKGALGVGYACNFIHQAALGLQHAHEEGLVHRDIKPGNLMFSNKGGKVTIKVLDFGLARATREEKVDASLTHEGQALGTPDFIAPEQILDAAKADIRADVYSLGGTLFYLLTGRPPFEGNSTYDVYQGHISRDAEPLNLIRPAVPVELAALVAKMLAKEPGRRFQTPGEVAEALSPFFKKGSVAFKAPRVIVPPIAQLTAEEPKAKAVSTLPVAENDAGSQAVSTENPSEPTVAEVRWESLIEIRGAEPLMMPTQAVASARCKRPRWLTLAMIATSALSLITMGLILYVATDYGRIKIIVNDPKAIVEVNHLKLVIKTLGESISLRAGEHDLTVKWRDGEFETGKFVIRRGSDEQLSVEYDTVVSNHPDAYRQTSRSAKTDPGSTAERPAAAPDNTQPTTVPEQTAENKNAPTKPFTNSIDMKLVPIPAGEFMMGMAPDQITDLRKLVEGRNDIGWFDRRFAAAALHRVTLTKRWLMGATEVTVRQFREFIQATSYVTEAEQYGFGDSEGTTDDGNVPAWMKDRTWRTPGYPVTNDSPVTQITWNDAVAFCNWLSDREKLRPCYQRGANGDWSVLTTGEGYRLPTEAEWEYACRAESKDEPTFAGGFAWLNERAWFEGNKREGAQRVALKPPNAFGLFDMRGNVFEWCQDWSEVRYYDSSPLVDPTGPSEGGVRVQRGGAWCFGPIECHSSFRAYSGPKHRSGHRGFRVVRVAAKDLPAVRQPPASTAKPIDLQDAPVDDAAQNGFARLFSGQKFEGWTGMSNAQSCDPSTVFRIENSDLAWTGIRGRIIHNKPVSDSAFKFDFLIPGSSIPGDIQGVAFPILILGGDSLYQFKGTTTSTRQVGLILSDGRTLVGGQSVGAGDLVFYETISGPNHLILPRMRAVTTEPGQWQVAEVRCEGTLIRFLLGGQQVNQIRADRHLVFRPGFASSGADIRLRNIWSGPVVGSPSAGANGREPAPLVVAEPKPDQHRANNAGIPVTERFDVLFDGKRTQGLAVAPENRGTSEIVGGQGLVLAGLGPPGSGPAELVTTRNDYRNFRIVAVLLNTDDRGKQIVVRRTRGSDSAVGYGVMVGGTLTGDNRTIPPGSINKSQNRRAGEPIFWNKIAVRVPAPVGEWHTIEISAIGNRLTTAVNGIRACEFIDPDDSFKSGEISFVCRGDSRIVYQSIILQELDETGNPVVHPEPPKLAKTANRKGVTKENAHARARNTSGNAMDRHEGLDARRRNSATRDPPGDRP